jgi:hypothetical protein
MEVSDKFDDTTEKGPLNRRLGMPWASLEKKKGKSVPLPEIEAGSFSIH